MIKNIMVTYDLRDPNNKVGLFTIAGKTFKKFEKDKRFIKRVRVWDSLSALWQTERVILAMKSFDPVLNIIYCEIGV